MDRLIQSKYGYYSVKDLPTVEELEDFYANKYYQDNTASHLHKYNSEELVFFENKAKVAEYILKNLKDKSLLDVGAGEGFFAKYFFDKQWNVTTFDYSDYGISTHNPEIKHTIVKNDIFQSIKNSIEESQRYGLINLSNVLEHVIDPVALLKDLKLLLNERSFLRISVPNDFSAFQEFLLNEGDTTTTWVKTPDHLHYFTFASLKKLLEASGYQIYESIGEFPIEIFLSNEVSNYSKKREVGKSAHNARVKTDNFLFTQGLKEYVDYYKASANIGFSRQVVIYAKKTHNQKINNV